MLVVSGIALSTAILTGALFIGDSMRYSLKQIVNARLGNITSVIDSRDRFFNTSLAETLSEKTGIQIAPVLITSGSAIADGGQSRVNNVQFVGTDPGFKSVSGTDIFSELNDNEVIVNENLAYNLKLNAGDMVLCRLAKASLMPLNTPFVSDAETTVSFRATIKSIVSSGQMGGFNLRNSQTTPYTIFLSLDRINKLMEFENKANHLLICGNIQTDSLSAALDESMQPEDIGLHYLENEGSKQCEISSDRIFLDSIVAKIFSDIPGRRAILTYFVNSIDFGNKSVPYSFVSSWDDLPVSDHEILINDWAAGDLGVRPGDSVQVSYFEIGPLRQLVEKKLSLKVKQIVPLSGEYGDPSLMPNIPGLSDAGHCRDWETGVPIKLNKIRQKDEDYWNRFKGTPKAFISGSLARKIWSNRYGSYTALRFPEDRMTVEKFRVSFSQHCKATDFGFTVSQAKEAGIKAAGNSIDFGQLFLSLSFFLLLSAIFLTSLLFRLNLETRETQIGTLLQLGFNHAQISRLFMAEGLALSIPGIVLGLVLAIGYVKVTFSFLNSIWWDIVRTSTILLKIEPLTLIAGAFVSLLISFLSVWFPLRSFFREPAISLQHKKVPEQKIAFPKSIFRYAVLLIFTAFLTIVFQFISIQHQSPGLFFLSGSLLLAGFMMLFYYLLKKNRTSGSNIPSRLFLIRMSVSGNIRRSMSITIIFSIGAFLVIFVGANRQIVVPSEQNRKSGTGGFGYFAETVIPVLYDINDPDRRLAEGLDTSFHVVQFLRMGGDDASCLNLNRTTNPSVLAVDAGEMEGRFDFQTITGNVDKANPWLSLKKSLPGNVVPAFADQTVIQWGLGMKAGDTLLYQNENGDTLRLKLTGGLLPSVLQGYILIDQTHFLRNYPSHSGSSVFLVDSHDEKVREEMSSIYRDNGIEIISATEKLAGFNSVTNTYISIFMALGILALAIGTIGLSIVVARTLLERRREMAIMLAIGFLKKSLAFQLVAEYSFLLITALGIGLMAALISLSPLILSGNSPVPAGLVFLVFAGIMLNGLFWIGGLAIGLIHPVKLLPALNDE
jgi:putative ABC transport system permease protein